jgi:dUTP pyrophosphatase
MDVKIKRLSPKAIIPTYSKDGDAGLDLVAIDRYFDEYGNAVYRTGLAFEIPQGYVGLVFPRSSVCKYDLTLTNAVGVIDSGYRGEVIAKFKPSLLFFDNPLSVPTSRGADENDRLGSIQTDVYTQYVGHNGDWYGANSQWLAKRGSRSFSPALYEVGERFAQMIILPYPKIQFVETENLSESERGNGGYGSSGK